MRNTQSTASLRYRTRAADDQKQAEVAVIVENITESLPIPPPTHDGGTDDTIDPIRESRHTSRPSAYPAWPTSQPGPLVTSPGPGQKRDLRRTDQIIYTGYDQERGMPCVPPASPVLRKQATAHPRIDLRHEEDSVEAYQRWLDDGGTSPH
jgi:hypothetical protein